MIEHIIPCMYNLYGPSWGTVTTFGYVFTDLRIYPPPSPSCGPTRSRGSGNQITAGGSKKDAQGVQSDKKLRAKPVPLARTSRALQAATPAATLPVFFFFAVIRINPSPFVE